VGFRVDQVRQHGHVPPVPDHARVCECVRVIERERERENVCACVRECVCVCERESVCVSVCV
jgi:hypothetical protein